MESVSKMKNPEHVWRCTFGFQDDLDPTFVEDAWWDFNVRFVATFRDHGWHVILKKGTVEITDPRGNHIEVPATSSDQFIAALKKQREAIIEKEKADEGEQL